MSSILHSSLWSSTTHCCLVLFSWKRCWGDYKWFNWRETRTYCNRRLIRRCYQGGEEWREGGGAYWAVIRLLLEQFFKLLQPLTQVIYRANFSGKSCREQTFPQTRIPWISLLQSSWKLPWMFLRISPNVSENILWCVQRFLKLFPDNTTIIQSIKLHRL